MMNGSGGFMMLTLKSGGFPVEVNTQKLKRTDSRQTGVFSVERFITYSVVGMQRLLSLKITKIIRNDRYGVLCFMDNELSGSYELRKINYCVPALDTEIVCYVCRESGDRSCFTLEKKKANDYSNVVERVKGTHSFVVGDETLNVKVKITNDSRVGLRVDVDGPVKVATDYSEYVLEKIQEKINGETEASAMLHFGNSTDQPPYVTNSGRSCYKMKLSLPNE
ncbi:hypothetical protein GLYMA_09G037600v4 [Glycine max]|uniref:Uncharacterized protein n=1 Tax=Glycine max TaxID=3847 RepID=A0A0R0ICD5_SOYBN|nr:hypothetical protein GYH30_023946 [Glycine max]KRH36996.1 hypothetical protein GLYMA_09G037600v4 [Glycine max]